jgi:hypothetical protein
LCSGIKKFLYMEKKLVVDTGMAAADGGPLQYT